MIVLRTALATSLLLFCADAKAEDTCLSTDAARKLVSQGDVLSPSQVNTIVVKRTGGEVVRSELCDEDGLYYKVVILSSEGEASKLRIDAKTGK